MSFNETLVYLVIFIALYNLIDFFRLRWKAVRNNANLKINGYFKEWAFVVVLVVSTFALTLVSVCKSYYGLRQEYAVGMSVLGSTFFVICNIILIRKLISAVGELLRLLGIHKKN